jgi:hypothetical protein
MHDQSHIPLQSRCEGALGLLRIGRHRVSQLRINYIHFIFSDYKVNSGKPFPLYPGILEGLKRQNHFSILPP